MDFWQLPGLMADMELVDSYLTQFLPPEPETGRVGEIISAVTEGKGKRFRPLLLLLAGRCGPRFGEVRDRLCKLGAVVELIHMASLVHDDIVDDSPLRRGQATVQARFGKDMAVYTGDLILSRTMGMVFSEGLQDAGALICETIERMCRGEIGQFDSRFHLDTTVERYLSNIEGKTVALFEAACRLGCRAAACDETLTEAVARFGRHLGYLFQIRDDLLDFLSEEAREGKPTHADFREGVFTLPVLLAYRESDNRDAFRSLSDAAWAGRFGEAETRELDRLVRECGGLAAAKGELEYHRSAALRLSELMPPSVGAAFRGVLGKLTVPGAGA